MEELDYEFKARIQLKHVNYFLLSFGFELSLEQEAEIKVQEVQQNPETY